MVIKFKLKSLSILAFALLLGTLALNLFMFTADTLSPTPAKAADPTLDYDFTESQPYTITVGHSDARLGMAWDGTYYYRCHVEGGGANDGHCRKATTVNGLGAPDVTDWVVSGLPRWPVGLWYDSAHNTFYMTSHNEFEYTYNFHYRSITLYKSTDGLQSVQEIGDIITSDNYTTPLGTDYNGRYVQDGPGDQDFFVDVPNGYAYVFYDNPTFNDYLINDYAHSLPSLPVMKPVQVARVALSDINDPSKWHKFYQGNWNQPALGGHASDLNANGAEAYVFYSTVLNRYVMFNQNNYTQYATSLDSQNWSPEYQLKTPHITDDFMYNPENILVDEDTHDSFRIGGGNVIAITSNGGPDVNVYGFTTVSYASNPYLTNVRPAIPPGEYANFFQQPYDPDFNGTPVENPTSVLMKWNDNPVNYSSGISTYADYTGTYNAAMMRATNVGDTAKTTINVTTPGLYRVYSYDRTFQSAGKWQLSVNGVNQGPVLDLYDIAAKYAAPGSSSVYYRRFDMGYINITNTGVQNLTYTYEGADPHSTNGGTDGQVDAVRFELVTDNFSDSNLNSLWSWVRQDSSKWSLSSGSLNLATSAGTLAGSSNNANNILLRQVYKAKFPYGDWEATTSVNFNPTSNGQSAGLIAYASDDNYARLSLANVGGTKSVLAELEQNGSLTSYSQPTNATTLYLRINKTNDRYTYYYSTDMINWTLLKQYEANLGTDWPQVGLTNYGSSTAATASFDWFDLRSGNYQDEGASSAAFKKPVTSDSTQSGSSASYAVDGDSTTSWTAADGNSSHSIIIDLGGSYGEHFNLNGSEFVPGISGYAYGYKIDVSSDDSNPTNWTNVVNKSNNTDTSLLLSDVFTGTNARFVRLTVTGDSNHYPSVSEFRVFAGNSNSNYQYNLPPLPTGQSTATPTPTPTNAPTSTPTSGANPTATPTPNGNGGTTYLSDLTWSSATTGYGSVQKDKSVNGNTITLNGNTYAKGIGTHAVSTIVYNISGAGYTNFSGDVGVDDECGTAGSVDFQIFLDSNTTASFDSGVMHGGDTRKPFSVNVSGVSQLKLVVGDGGDGINSDHADWAGAKFTSGSVGATATPTPTPTNAPTATATSTPTNPPTPTPTPTPSGGSGTYLSDLTYTSGTTGYGSIQKDKSVNGNPITLNGHVYTKGIGAHANSTIIYNISGAGYTNFSGDVGVDDESAPGGSVDFQIFLDNSTTPIFDSGVMHGGNTHKPFSVNVSGVSQLKIVIGDAGDGINSDHGDWAGAKLT